MVFEFHGCWFHAYSNSDVISLFVVQPYFIFSGERLLVQPVFFWMNMCRGYVKTETSRRSNSLRVCGAMYTSPAQSREQMGRGMWDRDVDIDGPHDNQICTEWVSYSSCIRGYCNEDVRCEAFQLK